MAFNVEISSVADRLTEGGTAQIYADISNTLAVQDMQAVRLEINGTERDSKNITLSGLGSERVLLEWETTQPSSDGAYTATVLSDDDSDSENFIVENPVVQVTHGEVDPSGSPPWTESRVDDQDIQ